MNGCSDMPHRGLLCIENELCSRSLPVKSSWVHSRNNKPVFEEKLSFIQTAPSQKSPCGAGAVSFTVLFSFDLRQSPVAGLPLTSCAYLYPGSCGIGD